MIKECMVKQVHWVLKSFDQLTIDELYSILQKRQDVFILEQHCRYPDLDDMDKKSSHLMGYVDHQLVAYARLFQRGLIFDDFASFGRVLVAKDSRKLKLGRALVQEIIRIINHEWEDLSIKIEAQYYLKSFYEEYGFIAQGDIFLDAGIEHIMMLRKI